MLSIDNSCVGKRRSQSNFLHNNWIARQSTQPCHHFSFRKDFPIPHASESAFFSSIECFRKANLLWIYRVVCRNIAQPSNQSSGKIDVRHQRLKRCFLPCWKLITTILIYFHNSPHKSLLKHDFHFSYRSLLLCVRLIAKRTKFLWLRKLHFSSF